MKKSKKITDYSFILNSFFHILSVCTFKLLHWKMFIVYLTVIKNHDKKAFINKEKVNDFLVLNHAKIRNM